MLWGSKAGCQIYCVHPTVHVYAYHNLKKQGSFNKGLALHAGDMWRPVAAFLPRSMLPDVWFLSSVEANLEGGAEAGAEILGQGLPSIRFFEGTFFGGLGLRKPTGKPPMFGVLLRGHIHFRCEATASVVVVARIRPKLPKEESERDGGDLSL